MISRLLNRPATLHRWTRADTKNAMGDYDHSFVDSTTYVQVQSRRPRSKEDHEDAQVGLTDMLCFLRPDVTVTRLDEITVDGIRYTFTGEPTLERNPRTGIASHYYGILQRVS